MLLLLINGQNSTKINLEPKKIKTPEQARLKLVQPLPVSKTCRNTVSLEHAKVLSQSFPAAARFCRSPGGCPDAMATAIAPSVCVLGS